MHCKKQTTEKNTYNFLYNVASYKIDLTEYPYRINCLAKYCEGL